MNASESPRPRRLHRPLAAVLLTGLALAACTSGPTPQSNPAGVDRPTAHREAETAKAHRG